MAASPPSNSGVSVTDSSSVAAPQPLAERDANHALAAGVQPAAKRPCVRNSPELTPSSVLVFKLPERPDLVYHLKPEDTLTELCRLLCTDLVRNSGPHAVYEHLWTFEGVSTLGARRTHKVYNFNNIGCERDVATLSKVVNDGHGVGSELIFTYDFGDPTTERLVLDAVVEDAALAELCPRRLPTPRPAGFQLHAAPEGTPTVDSLFPHLAKMEPESFCLFQPSRKQHHALVRVDSGYGCAILNWVPCRMRSVEEIFAGIDQACAVPLQGMEEGEGSYPFYNWEDRVVFTAGPFDQHADKVLSKVSDESIVVHVSQRSVDKVPSGYFAKAFPKCNSAYMAKKPCDRGWIVFKDGVLKVCRGASRTVPSNSPGAFKAELQYDPLPESVENKISHEFTTYHNLLCAAEGLWK